MSVVSHTLFEYVGNATRHGTDVVTVTSEIGRWLSGSRMEWLNDLTKKTGSALHNAGDSQHWLTDSHPQGQLLPRFTCVCLCVGECVSGCVSVHTLNVVCVRDEAAHLYPSDIYAHNCTQHTHAHACTRAYMCIHSIHTCYGHNIAYTRAMWRGRLALKQRGRLALKQEFIIACTTIRTRPRHGSICCRLPLPSSLLTLFYCRQCGGWRSKVDGGSSQKCPSARGDKLKSWVKLCTTLAHSRCFMCMHSQIQIGFIKVLVIQDDRNKDFPPTPVRAARAVATGGMSVHGYRTGATRELICIDTDLCMFVCGVYEWKGDVIPSCMMIEKFIIRQPPMGEKDDYDSENSLISDGLPSSSRRRISCTNLYENLIRKRGQICPCLFLKIRIYRFWSWFFFQCKDIFHPRQHINNKFCMIVIHDFHVTHLRYVVFLFVFVNALNFYGWHLHAQHILPGLSKDMKMVLCTLIDDCFYYLKQ